MIKIMIMLISCQIVFTASARKHTPIQQKEYLKARKQYLLEYTTFGVDECLKLHSDKIVTKDEGNTGKIVVGTPKYFALLSHCFSNITNKCYGENCIVSRSMSKRLRNVEHVDKILQKF